MKRFVVALTAMALLGLVASTVEAGSANCDGQNATITGTDGANHLIGTAGRDIIQARGGADVVEGRGSGDLICGGMGADRLEGEDGQDDVFGQGGDFDDVFGGQGDDKIYGGFQFTEAGNNDLGDGGPGIDLCVDFEFRRDCEVIDNN